MKLAPNNAPRTLALTLMMAFFLPAAQGGEAANEAPLMQGHEPAMAEHEIELELPDPETQLPLQELRKFTEVFDRIKRAYVEEISDTELLEKAIKGMLSGLDPHSAYLEPEAFTELEESTSGEFGGLGIEVDMHEDGFVRVIAPIDGTPAEKAGIQPGDLIIKLDETPVQGMTLNDAVKKMRGKPGEKITLTITREGETGPMEVELERAVIQVQSVRSEMLEAGYGYVRISNFQQKTGQDFVAELGKLREKHGGTLNGLILDLRNNPGGVLQAAVAVADAMLDEGLIVYTEGRIENSQLSFSASSGETLEGVPIVVLINAGSASASEIVAGALQDHGRAVVLGTDSFGKGSVQTVMPLGPDYAIKLTTARYFTPDGRSIQAKGIKPDIFIRQARLEDVESGERFTEADLTGHLGSGRPEGESRTRSRDTEKPENDLVARDYQLRSAVNLLKGMAIFEQRRKKNTQQPELD